MSSTRSVAIVCPLGFSRISSVAVGGQRKVRGLPEGLLRVRPIVKRSRKGSSSSQRTLSSPLDKIANTEPMASLGRCQLWQRPLDRSNSSLCDFRSADVKLREIGQSLQINQPSIGDLGFCKVEVFEATEPFQVHKPGVADTRVRQIELLESGQPFEAVQSGIGNLGLISARCSRLVSPSRSASPLSVIRAP